MKTGEIEVKATELTVFNRSEPHPVPDRGRDRHRGGEAPRHRYLDLRRAAAPAVAHHPLADERHHPRVLLVERGFLELETPFMGKYTPGGARNFLVPRRLNAGQVLRPRREPAALQAAVHGRGLRPVLPDRQVLPRRGPPARPPARVHPDRRRDELRQPGRRLRGGRGAHRPALEGGPRTSRSRRPFRRMPFDESMAKYGNDKPDLRFGLEHVDLTDLVVAARRRGRRPACSLEAVQQKGIVKAMVVPADTAALARRDRQARGVREGHGRQGPRPRQGRRGRASGRSRRSPRPSPRSCGRRSTRRAARSPATSSSSSSGKARWCRR